MRICGRCGIHAPPESAVCDECGSELRASARDAVAMSHRLVAVRIEVLCQRCDRFTPAPAVSSGGPVGCSRCGADTPFEERWWKKVFDRAHAVADLYGAHPEGREPSGCAIDAVNPFATRARRRSGVTFAADEADALPGWLPDELRVWMAPGLLLGVESHEPMQIRADAPGRISIRTSRGEAARYDVGARAVRLHPSLLGVVADEHRADREAPEVEVEGRDHRCPGCGATFQLDGGVRLVRCEACGLVAHVPAVVRMRLQADPRPDTWWFVFDGVSPYRRYLERDPSTWDEPYKDERPLERSPVPPASAGARAARALYVVGAPTLVLAVVGAMSRLPDLLAWLRAITAG